MKTKHKYKTTNNKTKKTKRINLKIQNIVIVGGGITGLYCYYKLLKERKIVPEKSILFEKSSKIGGRIQTIKVKKNNIQHSFETGAGRFSSNHKLLIQLIKELKLDNKIHKISGDSKFISNNTEMKKYKSVYYYFKKVLKESSPPPIVLSEGICPSGWIPCSKQ